MKPPKTEKKDKAEESDITVWTPEEASKYVSRMKLAEMLGVTRPTIANFEKKKHLTPILAKIEGEIGRPSIYYDPEEVALLEQHKRRIDEQRAGAGDEEFGETIFDEPNAPAPGELLGAAQVVGAITGAMRQAQSHAQILMEKSTALMTSVDSIMNKMSTAFIEENTRIRTRMTELEVKTWEAWGKIREAQDVAHIREIEEQDASSMRAIKEKASEELFKYLPMLGMLVGGKFAPGSSALKEAALTSVIDNMSVEQVEAIIAGGQLDPASASTLLTVKERLVEERQARLKKQAEVIDREEAEKAEKKAASA